MPEGGKAGRGGKKGTYHMVGGGGSSNSRSGTVPEHNAVPDTGIGILGALMGVWGGTREQVEQLSRLQYKNGGGLIIVPERRDIIMEVVGMLQKETYENVLAFLSEAVNPDYILWEQHALEEGHVKILRESTILQTEETGIKGYGKCKYCSSTELVVATKQMRSGDEPTTIFVRCILCKKGWKG